MNDPGIYKIYYIKKSKTSFPYDFLPGKIYDITSYLSASLTELEFDKSSFRLNSFPEKTSAGKLVKTSAQFTVSGITNATDSILSAIEDEPHVFIFEDIEGQFYFLGTNYFRPVFLKNYTHDDPPSSKKYYNPTITLEAPFGLVFCTIT